MGAANLRLQLVSMPDDRQARISSKCARQNQCLVYILRKVGVDAQNWVIKLGLHQAKPNPNRQSKSQAQEGNKIISDAVLKNLKWPIPYLATCLAYSGMENIGKWPLVMWRFPEMGGTPRSSAEKRGFPW